MQSEITPQLFGKEYISIQRVFSGEFSEAYEVKDSSSHRYFLELFRKGISPKKIAKEIQKEIYINSMGKKISHLEYISSGSDLRTKKTYIIYEWAEKGTLKNYLISGKCFDERLSKITFWKIAKDINNLHKIGIAHRNITLDNILIDSYFNLKIAGFGSSQFIKDVRLKECSVIENDIFQLGVLLLQLISGRCDLKILESKLLKDIQKGKLELLWRTIEMQNNQKFSNDIKALINIMLTIKYDKQKKWKLDELLNAQAWFKDMESKENEDYFKEKLRQLEDPEKNFLIQ